MKLYTIYSPSHRELYENFFLKSIPNEFEIIAVETPQYCSTGNFYQDGWDKTCYEKVKLYEKACQDNQGQHFIFSDVDVQFFGSVKDQLLKEIGDADIAVQRDSQNLCCSGFWICKGSEKTLKMFSRMKLEYKSDDQEALNSQIHLTNFKFLPESFFNVSRVLQGEVWEGQDFEIPDDILLHHANWTIGVKNKINLLNLVKEKVNARNSRIKVN